MLERFQSDVGVPRACAVLVEVDLDILDGPEPSGGAAVGPRLLGVACST